jgi:hypothetical protein
MLASQERPQVRLELLHNPEQEKFDVHITAMDAPTKEKMAELGPRPHPLRTTRSSGSVMTFATARLDHSPLPEPALPILE